MQIKHLTTQKSITITLKSAKITKSKKMQKMHRELVFGME